MTDDAPIDKPELSDSVPKPQVFVLRVWREADGSAPAVRLRIVSAANDTAPRYFTSWQALAEWGERDDDEPNPG